MLKRKRTDPYQEAAALLSLGHGLVVEGSNSDLNPYSATKNRKEETFESKGGLRITISNELERHGQEAMLKWQFCAAFFFFFFVPLPSGFHIHPVKKIASKDNPSTQTRRPSEPALLQQLRGLELHIPSTRPWLGCYFPP